MQQYTGQYKMYLKYMLTKKGNINKKYQRCRHRGPNLICSFWEVFGCIALAKLVNCEVSFNQ